VLSGYSLEKSIFKPLTEAVLVAPVLTSGVKNPLWFGLGERLLAARERCGLSQEALSVMAGINESAARHIEIGRSVPTLSTVENLACALGISPTWLAFGFDGFEAWRERVPRKGEPERAPPTPKPAQRPCPETYRGIPERLRLAREQSGLSMRAIARATELSAQTIALIEAGRSVPLISNIEAIAKSLTVSPGWLAFGEIDEYE